MGGPCLFAPFCHSEGFGGALCSAAWCWGGLCGLQGTLTSMWGQALAWLMLLFPPQASRQSGWR